MTQEDLGKLEDNNQLISNIAEGIKIPTDSAIIREIRKLKPEELMAIIKKGGE